jgi:hypothetical protein
VGRLVRHSAFHLCPSLGNWRFVCGEREQDTQPTEKTVASIPREDRESESAGLPKSEPGAHDQEKVANQVKVMKRICVMVMARRE